MFSYLVKPYKMIFSKSSSRKQRVNVMALFCCTAIQNINKGNYSMEVSGGTDCAYGAAS